MRVALLVVILALASLGSGIGTLELSSTVSRLLVRDPGVLVSVRMIAPR